MDDFLSSDYDWPLPETDLIPNEPALVCDLALLGGVLHGNELILVDRSAPENLLTILDLSRQVVDSVVMYGKVWSDRHLELLSRLPKLTTFKISQCGELTDEALVHMSLFPNIQRIDLSGVEQSRFTLSGFSKLSNASGLAILTLPRNWPVPLCNDLTGLQCEQWMNRLSLALPNVVIRK